MILCLLGETNHRDEMRHLFTLSVYKALLTPVEIGLLVFFIHHLALHLPETQSAEVNQLAVIMLSL